MRSAAEFSAVHRAQQAAQQPWNATGDVDRGSATATAIGAVFAIAERRVEP